MTTYIVATEHSDRAAYLAEMLSLWGGAFARTTTLDEVRRANDAHTIVVPGDVSIDDDTIASLASRCRHLILIAPSHGRFDGTNNARPLPIADAGHVAWLRLTEPLLGTFSHHSLPVVGPHMQPLATDATGILPDSIRVLAWFYDVENPFADRPALWSTSIGTTTVTTFGYDLVACTRNLRQGDPRFAEWRPTNELHARPCDLFGPDWERNCPPTDLPIADFHSMLLLTLIESHQPHPMPRLWTLPGEARSAILISGDEDNADPANNEAILSFLDSLGATMTTYILMDDTHSTPEHLADWMRRGHHFSVHPYPKLKSDDWLPRGDIFQKLRKCFTDFAERYSLPMKTVRTHRLFWTGYDDLPKLWASFGVEMDCTYGYNYRFRGMNGFFASPAASLPIHFLSSDFQRIGVYQQPCHLGDDTCFNHEGRLSRRLSPALFETYADTLISQILEPTGTPFAVCFHPINFTTFANSAEKKFLTRAHALGAMMMSDGAWLEFWTMRSSWQIASIEATEHVYRYRLEGTALSRNLSITVPATFSEGQVACITIDGAATDAQPMDHFGHKRFLVSIPDGITACQLSLTIH